MFFFIILAPGLKYLRNEERLNEYGLTTLEMRRLGGGSTNNCLRYGMVMNILIILFFSSKLRK